MARLPDYTSLGTSVPQSNRQIVSYDTNTVPAAMARLGGALESASGKLYDVEKKQRDSATALQKAQTASALYRDDINIRNELQSQNKHEGLPETYNERMAAALEERASAISDPQERALFTTQWSQHISKGLNDVYRIQREKRKEAGLASLLQTSEDNMKSAVSANEMTGETLRRMTHDAIDLAAASNMIGADDAVRKKLAWDEKYSTMRLAGMIESGQAADVIKMLSSSGDDNSLLQKISMIESGGNAGAVNQQSGAAGLFQFMPETAKQYGLSDADRFDPDKSKAAAAALLNDNRNALRSKLGRPPTDGELYLAHQQGATGAANLLANPDAKAVDVVGSQAVLQNGGSKDMTAGEFAAKWTRKLDNGVVGMLPVEKRLQLLKAAETALSVDERMAEKQRKQQQFDTMNSMIEKAYSDQLTVSDIIADKTLEPSQRENMLSMLQKATSGEGRTDPKVFNQLFQRIHADGSDPQRITDPEKLIPYIGNGLGMTDLDRLRKEIAGRGTPDGEAESMLKKQFFEMAKNKISGTNSFTNTRDPKGDELYLKFMKQALPEYESGRAAGKPASQLLDPDSKDYIGKNITSFARPYADQFKDMMEASGVDGAVDYKTPADLVNAYKSSKISLQELTKILVEKGWARPDDNASPKVPMGK